VSYVEEVPKFNAIVLTNVKAVRSYVYILKFYEKIDIDSLQTKANPHLLKLEKKFPSDENVKIKIETPNANREGLESSNTIDVKPRVLKFDSESDEDDVNKSKASSNE